MTHFFTADQAAWKLPQDLNNQSYVCGYCSTFVSSVKGYALGKHKDGSGGQVGGAYICPNCQGPTFVVPDGRRFPQPVFGKPVSSVPESLESLYEEARRCTGQSAFTGAVLLCRKMLMNIAVAQGAVEGLRFIEYVDYLSSAGFVPPNGRHWVDHIRKRGNEATHEITLMTEQDAKELLVFVEMLLRFIYEFPSMVPP